MPALFGDHPPPAIHGLAMPDFLDGLLQQIAADQRCVVAGADVAPGVHGAVGHPGQAAGGGGRVKALGNAIAELDWLSLTPQAVNCLHCLA